MAHLAMMKEFAVVVAEVPAQVLFVAEGAVALGALEGPIFVVDHLDVAFQIAAAREPGVAQVAGVRSLVRVRLQMGLERVGLHDAMARQALDARPVALAHYDSPHLDAPVAFLLQVLQVVRVLCAPFEPS